MGETEIEGFVEVNPHGGFPAVLYDSLPETQFKVELGVEFTVADFAYPAEKVLLFIDGMSERLHGNPVQQRKDRLKRAKAKIRGYQVLAISAEGLKDTANVAGLLDELALLLGREDLLPE